MLFYQMLVETHRCAIIDRSYILREYRMPAIPTRLYQTLVELVGIPSTSGHEEQVCAYLQERLSHLKLSSQLDPAGNLIAMLPGEGGPPLLLNAHMDIVPPGLAHTPVL